MKRLLLLVAFAALFGQSQNQKQTVPTFTGRMWVALPDSQKTWYVAGVNDGIMVASAWADPANRQQILSTRAVGFFAGEYIKELDAFYKNTENLPIPIPMAYNWCNLKLRGTETNEYLERKLIELRQFAAKY